MSYIYIYVYIERERYDTADSTFGAGPRLLAMDHASNLVLGTTSSWPIPGCVGQGRRSELYFELRLSEGLIIQYYFIHSLTVAIPPEGGIGGAAHKRSDSLSRVPSGCMWRNDYAMIENTYVCCHIPRICARSARIAIANRGPPFHWRQRMAKGARRRSLSWHLFYLFVVSMCFYCYVYAVCFMCLFIAVMAVKRSSFALQSECEALLHTRPRLGCLSN